MSAPAAILCTQCGNASATPLSQCVKCGGKNSRVCGGCGFQNSLAKNYCDKCGNPISELAPVIAPPPATAVPGAPKAEIPATVLKNIPKSPEKKAPSPALLPAAKLKAVEPGAAMGPSAPLPAAGRQAPDPFAAPAVSGDLWAAAPPTQADAVHRTPRWIATLRRALTAGFVTFAVIAALIGAWYVSENSKPENAVQQAAVRYLDALRMRDFNAAYGQFSESARKYCTLEEFVATRDTSTWTWSNLRVEHAEPGAMLLAYDLNVQGTEKRVDRVLFVEENRKWVRPYSWALMQKVEESFDKNNADMGLVLAQAAATVNPRDPMARGYLCEAAY